MSVTHWQLLAEERDRQQRHDETRARHDLGYPTTTLARARAIFEPHRFIPFADTKRHPGCVKCGRPKDDPVHTTIREQAA